jgi:CRISPR-associated endoribonuclease Cas6
MRFKLSLQVDRNVSGDILPINYQYELSAAIYRMLAGADSGYATWLHENGFTMENGKQFKFFNFSPFFPMAFEQKGDRFRILSDTVTWYISLLPLDASDRFIRGIFENQTFRIGDRRSAVQFSVRQIESIPSPTFLPEMDFRTLSPVCIAVNDAPRHVTYLSPESPEAADSLCYGLTEKYRAFYGQSPDVSDFHLSLLSSPKSKLVTIKADTPNPLRIRGYLFRFRLRASSDIMSILYNGGLGVKCSMGFGMVEVDGQGGGSSKER